MRLIEYRGHHDTVDVPRWQLGEVPANTPIEVADDVADDLTLHGTSEQWVDVTDVASVKPAKAKAAASDVPLEG